MDNTFDGLFSPADDGTGTGFELTGSWTSSARKSAGWDCGTALGRPWYVRTKPNLFAAVLKIRRIRMRSGERGLASRVTIFESSSSDCRAPGPSGRLSSSIANARSVGLRTRRVETSGAISISGSLENCLGLTGSSASAIGMSLVSGEGGKS